VIDFGLTPAQFHAEYFEKRPYLRKGALGSEPFAWSELDDVLHAIAPAAPMFQLWNGGPIDEARYADRVLEFGAPRLKLDRRRFFAELEAGATLVVNRFESHCRRALRLGAEIGRFADAPTVGNAYLSIGGRGTFGRHWDTHDVFALQLIGRKRWQVYSPTFPLPLGRHTSRDSGHSCPPTPALDCVLEAGDLLYVPRGWWHHAIPFAAPSLHFSVGTYAATVHDYVLWACARHLPAFADARRSLTAAVGPGELDDVLSSLRDAVLDGAHRAEYEREIAGSRQPAAEIHSKLFLSAGPAGLRDGALITLNPGHTRDPKTSDLVVNGARLRLHPLTQSIVAALEPAAALPIEALYERLPRERREAIRAAVLELALHEIVALELPDS
jgi:cupin superfamily protein